MAESGDEEAGPGAPYEPESESDDDEDDGVEPTPKRAHAGGAEPTAKKAREFRALSTPNGFPPAQTSHTDKVPRE